MSKNEELIIGKNCVVEVLKARPQQINKIFYSNHLENDILELIKKHKIPYVKVDKTKLDKMTGYQKHQGYAAFITAINYFTLEELLSKLEHKKNPMLLILDEVTDVNNFGSILRSADAFSIDGIIINSRRSAPVNSTVARISMGASNFVDICRVNNLVQAIKTLKNNNFWVAALDMDGTNNVYEDIYQQPLAIIIGGEDKGISNMMKKNSDFSITIPMGGHVNSLNVSNAVSIICSMHYYDRIRRKNE